MIIPLVPAICEQCTKCPFATFQHFPAPLTPSSIVIWPWHLLALVITERLPDDQSQFDICLFCLSGFHNCTLLQLIYRWELWKKTTLLQLQMEERVKHKQPKPLGYEIQEIGCELSSKCRRDHWAMTTPRQKSGLGLNIRKNFLGLSWLFDFSWEKNVGMAIFILILVSFIFSWPAVICLLLKRK